MTASARIRVKALNNIFFNISDKNFKFQHFNFSGLKDEADTVNLLWITSDEINSIYYQIERSMDSVNFRSSGIINQGSKPDSAEQFLLISVGIKLPTLPNTPALLKRFKSDQ